MFSVIVSCVVRKTSDIASQQMLMNASTMNQMQKATRAASRRKTSNRSINYPIIKSIINQKNNAYSAKQISQPIIPSIIVQNLIVKHFFRSLGNGYWPSFPNSAAKLQRDTAKTCQHLKKNAFFLGLAGQSYG